jgi:EpsI family protein
MSVRLLVAAAVLFLGGTYLQRAGRVEILPARESLASCPLTIDVWHGRDAPAFDARILQVLGVDEYLNRVYSAADGTPVGLYIGYYGSQRQGDSIHSPLNCLPGAGWAPVQHDQIGIPVSTRVSAESSAGVQSIRVNRYIIEKGLDRQLVLYWYQSHGRVVASEYWGKIYMVIDAIRMNRTDGALVRVIAPIVTTEDDAERAAVTFVQMLFPHLDRYLPA